MDKIRQAAQQALEAMEDAMYRADTHEFYEAKEALRAALAEPEQEPDGISWLKRDSGYFTAPTPRKPLTMEQLHGIREHQRLLEELGPVWAPMLYYFCQSIERAHGIGEKHE